MTRSTVIIIFRVFVLVLLVAGLFLLVIGAWQHDPDEYLAAMTAFGTMLWTHYWTRLIG